MVDHDGSCGLIKVSSLSEHLAALTVTMTMFDGRWKPLGKTLSLWTSPIMSCGGVVAGITMVPYEDQVSPS